MIMMDAVVLGGGKGTRFLPSASAKSDLQKQFQILGDLPVFAHAVKAFLGTGLFRSCVLVFPEEHLGIAVELVDRYLPAEKSKVKIVAGGNTRQESSLAGLMALAEMNPPPTRVLVHDACRPFVGTRFLSRIADKLRDRSYGAWVPVVPTVETLKRVENAQVVETVDRSAIHRVQTPQIFEFEVIHSLAHKIKDADVGHFTDDASLCEYYGIPVGVFEGDVRNIKLTYEFEVEPLRSFLENEPCESDSDMTFTA